MCHIERDTRGQKYSRNNQIFKNFSRIQYFLLVQLEENKKYINIYRNRDRGVESYMALFGMQGIPEKQISKQRYQCKPLNDA